MQRWQNDWSLKDDHLRWSFLQSFQVDCLFSCFHGSIPHGLLCHPVLTTYDARCLIQKSAHLSQQVHCFAVAEDHEACDELWGAKAAVEALQKECLAKSTFTRSWCKWSNYLLFSFVYIYIYLRFFEGHEIRHASPTRYINIEEEIVYKVTPAWIKVCLGGVCWLHKRHELLRKLDISLKTVASIAWSS